MSPGSGGSFSVIDSITTNLQGHVTNINTLTVTLPQDTDNYVDVGSYSNSTGTLSLTRTGGLADVDVTGFLEEAPSDGSQYARQNGSWSVVSGGGGGGVTGAGTTNTLPIWTDGPNGILNDSSISQVLDAGNNVKEINILTTSGLASDFKINGAASKVSFISGTTGNDLFLLSGDNTGFYTYNFQMRGTLAVGRSSQASNATLDVGTSTDTIPAAWFRNGVVISNNPSGVQVDNTSMVIGAGNNDNVSGSDHCLIVGSGNQITSNSDRSVAFGQSNALTSSIDAFAVGNSNTLTSSLRTQALGFNNTIIASSSFIAGGGNSITATSNIFALGDNHTVTGTTQDAYLLGTANTITGGTGSFAIGSNLDGDAGNHMVIGYRNNKTSYPATNYSLGLGNTKFALAVGSTTTTNSNALLITEGGVTRGGSGVAQVPRVVLPTVTTFSASNDAAADALGVPQGALYQNQGVVQINRGGGSTTDPLAGGGGGNEFPNGLYIGGTTSANLLDDYEEGTFTPTLTVTGTSTSLNDILGRYTKIGNLVYVEIHIRDFVPEDLTTQIRNCTNLPFTILNTTFTTFATGTLFNSSSYNTGRGLVYGLDNTTTITFYDNGFYTDLPGDETTEVTINITYTTS